MIYTCFCDYIIYIIAYVLFVIYLFVLEIVINQNQYQSVLSYGRSFISNSGIKPAVLPKGRSSTANSETKVAALQVWRLLLYLFFSVKERKNKFAISFYL